MKITKQMTVIGCALSLLVSSTVPAYAESDMSYRQLLDYAIFNGSGNINWCGGQNLEVSNARVPVDSEVTCDGVSSLRVNVTNTSNSWSVRLVVRSWMSIDFSQYQPDGCLEFDVKGNAGNEKFRIGLADHTGEDVAAVSVGEYAGITNEWQHVSIPLSDLMAKNPDTDISDIKLLYLLNDGTTDAQKFWITNIEVTSEGFERESPHIKVNQAGFKPDAAKYALVSFYPERYNISDGDTFSVCKAETGESVYDGTLQLLSEFDQRDSGEKVLKADFSELHTSGNYYIAVDGLAHSVNFSVSDNVYEGALAAAQKYFYYQRQGISLEKEYAGEFARDDLGLDDSSVPFASGKSGTIASEKGWFDAGDSGKYVNTGAGTVSSLLWAYEMFPQVFPDNALNIPESGNGIPDLLDEARWELEWILTMQDAESGGFYPRIQGDAGERTVMDENGCTTDDTACAVGVLAEAYMSYKEFDPEFADICLAAAEKGWEFLKNHSENIVGYDVYVVSDDVPDRLWAAGALYHANGNPSCREYFEENYSHIQSKFEDSYAYANRWGSNWLTGCWHYLLCGDDDAQVSQWLTDEIDIWREILLTTKWENNIWGVPLHKGNYFRGITAEICNMAMALSVTDEILDLNDSRTLQCAESSLSWLLGANPLGISYVSGCGENSIKTIYSQIYENDGIDEIPAGYLPQGPNYTAMKTYCRFAAKCYMDSQNDWVTNEHTVYGNGVLVYLLAQVSSEEQALIGDVNADGTFTIADAIMLQKWLVCAGDLTDRQAGDLCADGRINVLDLCRMKHELLNQ
ncbi:MAG: glycoside hydrolase family 9 protein [Ruminococcus sp.]|nr:glycoside hydrolase family 9 protein [Ruminococcus sp.]